ncbi:MAG: hypothetical protein MUF76_16195 [Hydrogenophaga sp.]|nr:hypothetical protein [Hydrogenophaga sp.]
MNPSTPRQHHHRARRWAAVGVLVLTCGLVPAQVPATACDSADLAPNQLWGRWVLTLWPEGGSAGQPTARGLVQFERHPEFAGSVRGQLVAQPGLGERLLSGDAVDGEFVLDESEDGVAISAVWTARVEPTDCGQRLQGIRRPAENRPAHEVPLRFELRKEAGWQ